MMAGLAILHASGQRLWGAKQCTRAGCPQLLVALQCLFPRPHMQSGAGSVHGGVLVTKVGAGRGRCADPTRACKVYVCLWPVRPSALLSAGAPLARRNPQSV